MPDLITIPPGSVLEAINDIAWADFIRFAFDFPPIADRFYAETGLPRLATGGINRAIDEANGLPADIAWKFIKWATVNQWGLECAPVKVREQIEREAKEEKPKRRRKAKGGAK